jgi:putative RNA 2'-phosphotransferase
MDYAALSKTVSHALRHDPEAYGLDLDPDGWVAVRELLVALRQRSAEWAQVSEAELSAMIQGSAKRRHELAGGRIRALYGHSTPDRIPREAQRPPEFLYHGTDAVAATEILKEGLKPMGRQYVHLSPEVETAREVGKRKGAGPVILVVRALEAFKCGVAFYEGNPSVWLADHVPATFFSAPS